MAANEIARLAEVAIGREHEREERLAVDGPEHQAHARERDDRLADRPPAQRIGRLADLLEDAPELDACTADVLLERALRNPVGHILLDRDPVGAHQHRAESTTALVDDVAKDRAEAHGCSLRIFSSQRSSAAIAAALGCAGAASLSPSAARMRAAPRRSPWRSSRSAIVRVANAPLATSGLRSSGAASARRPARRYSSASAANLWPAGSARAARSSSAIRSSAASLTR